MLAVVDVAESRLTALATHVLPATGQLERADVTLAELTALRSGLQATRPIVAAAAERRPVWWMFAALSRAMGRPSLGGADPDSLTDEDVLRGVLAHSTLDPDDVFAAGPRGVETPVEYDWVHTDLLADGRWAIAPAPLLERLVTYRDSVAVPFVLAPRREMAWSNSVRYGAGADRPVVRMHPKSADGATDGGRPARTELVELVTPEGRITASVAIDPNVRPGVVSISHGHPDADPGALTSGVVGVDPLTTMPRVAGLEVRVAIADRPRAGEPPT